MSEIRGLRPAGVLLIVVLIAMAVVMLLREREVKEAEKSVSHIADGLRETGVTPRKLDQREARHLLRRLQRMVDGHTTVSAVELESAAARAASWAEAALTPSPELTAAVALRAAANDLRSFVLLDESQYRRSAAHHLARARSALEGETPTSSMQGMRDRMENVEESQREKLQQLNEALK